ncbi:MAG: hypothetical protein KDD61_09265, partial [Bdellovibrionales bacterium]|nr:hypothetical protein [Bdellovibrionales bacterium]
MPSARCVIGVGSKKSTQVKNKSESRVRSSYLRAAVTEATGMVRSPFKLLMYKWFGFFGKELGPYFGKEKLEEPLSVVQRLEDVAEFMSQLDQFLKGKGQPEKKMRNDLFFKRWELSKAFLAKNLRIPLNQLSEYVAFLSGREFLFFQRKGGQLIPVHLSVGDGGVQMTPLVRQRILQKGRSQLEVELEISAIVQKEFPSLFVSYRLRRLSQGANDIKVPRDRQFEWDGSYAQSLRANGGYSFGLFQLLSFYLPRKGISVTRDGRIEFLVKEPIAAARKYAELVGKEESFEKDLHEYVSRYVYHTYLVKWLQKNPNLIHRFLRSAHYLRLAQPFVDTHVSYVGATHLDVATGVVAALMLRRFEIEEQNIRQIDESPSLFLLAKLEGELQEAQSWIVQNGTSLAPKDIPEMVATLGTSVPFSAKSVDRQFLIELASKVERKVYKLKGEMARWPKHQRVNRILGRVMGWNVSDKARSAQTALGQMLLAKDPGTGDFTVSAFFNPARVDGYLGRSVKPFAELPVIRPAARAVSEGEVIAILREVLSHESYQQQVESIVRWAPLLIKFLLSSRKVSEDLRDFLKQTYSEDFIEQVYSRLNTSTNPNVISRFFPDSTSEFQKMQTYRYLFEFVHGVTSLLVRSHLPRRYHLERSFLGNWRYYNFSHVNHRQLTVALEGVLNAA